MRNFLLGTILVILAQGFMALCVIYTLPDWQTRGQFGDLFGAANALFSGLAFAGLIYTVFLQKEELSLQRKELELTRQELSRSAAAQEKSEQALSQQATASKLTAELAAINNLLEHVNRELVELTKTSWVSHSPTQKKYEHLMDKKRKLDDHLDRVYTKVTQAEND